MRHHQEQPKKQFSPPHRAAAFCAPVVFGKNALIVSPCSNHVFLVKISRGRIS